MSRPKKELILFTVLVLLLAGCTSLSRVSVMPSRTAASIPGEPLLDPQKSVFVAMPEDGGSATLWYVGSGRVVADAVGRAFARRGVPVRVSERPMTNDGVFASATRSRAGYVVLPAITWWEHNNDWLGAPSRLTVRIAIIDMSTGKVIASDPVLCYAPLASLTNPAPDILLAGPLSDYLDSLYNAGLETTPSSDES